MTFKVLGIDQGIANLGYAVLAFKVDKIGNVSAEVLEHKYVKTTSKYYIGTRLESIETELLNVFKRHRIKAISCEKLFFSKGSEDAKTNKFRNKSASMVYTNLVTGVIYTISSKKGIPLVDFTPGTVKKEICGNGTASKEDMMNAIQKKFGIEGLCEHEADAIGIAYKVGLDYIENSTQYDELTVKIKAKEKIKK